MTDAVKCVHGRDVQMFAVVLRLRYQHCHDMLRSPRDADRRRRAGNMQPRYQRSLQAKLQENAPMYGLSEVTFRSFMLKRGWSRVGSELTAADTVAAVTALLEASGRQDDPDNTHTAKFWCDNVV